MMLRVAQLVPDTEAEGPGRRFAVWVQGCTLRCPGCCNPEMFSSVGGVLVDPLELGARIASAPGLEGVSVLGGEPFQQATAVAALCRVVQAAGRTVMVYSGYTLEELRAQRAPEVSELLGTVDVLADGRFERDNPERRRRWLGSANQRLHFLTSRYAPDDARFVMPNTVELRWVDGQLTINGWPAAADALHPR